MLCWWVSSASFGIRHFVMFHCLTGSSSAWEILCRWKLEPARDKHFPSLIQAWIQSWYKLRCPSTFCEAWHPAPLRLWSSPPQSGLCSAYNWCDSHYPFRWICTGQNFCVPVEGSSVSGVSPAGWLLLWIWNISFRIILKLFFPFADMKNLGIQKHFPSLHIHSEKVQETGSWKKHIFSC